MTSSIETTTVSECWSGWCEKTDNNPFLKIAEVAAYVLVLMIMCLIPPPLAPPPPRPVTAPFSLP